MLTGSVPLVSWAQEPVLFGQWIVLLDTTALLPPRAPPSTPVLGALSGSVLVEEASKTVDLAPQGTSAWIQVTRLSYHSLTTVLALATGLAQKGRKKSHGLGLVPSNHRGKGMEEGMWTKGLIILGGVSSP